MAWTTSKGYLKDQEILAQEETDFAWEILIHLKVVKEPPVTKDNEYAYWPPDAELTPLEYYTEYLLKQKKLAYLAELFLPRSEALSLALFLKREELIRYYVQTHPPLNMAILDQILNSSPEIIRITGPLLIRESLLFRQKKTLPASQEVLSTLLEIFDKAGSLAALQHVLHVGNSISLAQLSLKPIWQREMLREAAPVPEYIPSVDRAPPSLRKLRHNSNQAKPVLEAVTTDDISALQTLLQDKTPSWMERASEMKI